MSATAPKGFRWTQLDKDVNQRLLDFYNEDRCNCTDNYWELGMCQKVGDTRMTKNHGPSCQQITLSSIFVCLFV